MAYLPKFSPLCAPDTALNAITSALIFHFSSFTSIRSVTRKMSGKGNNSLLYPVPDSDDTCRVGEKDTGVVRMKLWVRLGVGMWMRRMEKESRM